MPCPSEVHISACFEVYNKMHMFGNAQEGKFMYAIRMSGMITGTPGYSDAGVSTATIEAADGGTIFLDEIGEMPLELQPKLLRVLQDGEFDPLGSTKTTKVDVRVIAATNRDLEKMVRNGEFREDLFYRLNVFPIHNIPLRERREDIPVLTEFFLRKYSKQYQKPGLKLTAKAMGQLKAHGWPGNIRE
mgnify:CR=1 FL=1